MHTNSFSIQVFFFLYIQENFMTACVNGLDLSNMTFDLIDGALQFSFSSNKRIFICYISTQGLYLNEKKIHRWQIAFSYCLKYIMIDDIPYRNHMSFFIFYLYINCEIKYALLELTIQAGTKFSGRACVARKFKQLENACLCMKFLYFRSKPRPGTNYINTYFFKKKFKKFIFQNKLLLYNLSINIKFILI